MVWLSSWGKIDLKSRQLVDPCLHPPADKPKGSGYHEARPS